MASSSNRIRAMHSSMAGCRMAKLIQVMFLVRWEAIAVDTKAILLTKLTHKVTWWITQMSSQLLPAVTLICITLESKSVTVLMLLSRSAYTNQVAKKLQSNNMTDRNSRKFSGRSRLFERLEYWAAWTLQTWLNYMKLLIHLSTSIWLWNTPRERVFTLI